VRPPPDSDRRPSLATGAPVDRVGDAPPTIPGTGVLDLVRLAPRDRRIWDDAYLSGYLAGHEAGIRFADDRAATLHREAVRVVHALADVEPADPARAVARDAERARLGGVTT